MEMWIECLPLKLSQRISGIQEASAGLAEFKVPHFDTITD